MKRIALLLAAVGFGSGCVVSTCDTGTLTVDWAFQGHNGDGNLGCSDVGATGLSQAVGYVDVYLDGARVVAAEPCSSLGVSISALSSGSHNVTVEGYDANNQYIVTRDWFPVSIAACGDSYFPATPGEAIIDIQPTNCSVGSDNLTYSLSDVTSTPSYVISSITPTSTNLGTFSCGGGINFPVPWGSYDLTKVEETNSTATVVYASKCTTTAANVPLFSAGLVTTNFAFTNTGTSAFACTWP
jgi:hypothetical protein